LNLGSYLILLFYSIFKVRPRVFREALDYLNIRIWNCQHIFYPFLEISESLRRMPKCMLFFVRRSLF